MVAVLSDRPELREEFCKALGKETSRRELVFYNLEAKDITLVDMTGYPEKIQPLLYALSMAEYVVLVVDVLTPKIGEIIVALNSLQCERGLIVSKSSLPIAGTTLERFDNATDMEAAKARISSLQPTEAGENVFGLIDHMENVPSLGHVAHGVLKSGKLKKADTLFVLPGQKEVEVRSIQLHGREVEEASAGTMFSMAYKGEPFERSILVPLRHEHEMGNVINGKFIKSPFYKDELKGKIHAYADMQFVEGHLNESDITLNQPLAYEKGGRILIVDASNQKLRIMGAFQSRW